MNLDNAWPKDMANLATNSCKMPLNQQLQPVTEYEQFDTLGILQYAWSLIGLKHAMSCITQETDVVHMEGYITVSLAPNKPGMCYE